MKTIPSEKLFYKVLKNIGKKKMFVKRSRVFSTELQRDQAHSARRSGLKCRKLFLRRISSMFWKCRRGNYAHGSSAFQHFKNTKNRISSVFSVQSSPVSCNKRIAALQEQVDIAAKKWQKKCRGCMTSIN